MRILLADDHPMFLDALGSQIERLRPDATIVKTTNLDGIQDRAGHGDVFDLVLVDYDMPGVSGTEGVAKVIEAFPLAIVAVISGRATSANVHAAIQAGARGFLPKTLAPDQFAAAFSTLLTGTTYVPVEVVRDLLVAAHNADDNLETVAPDLPNDGILASLSAREHEVLRGLAEGLSNKEIGRNLSLAEITVKLHVRQILKKMGARNRADAAAKAMRSRRV